MRDIKRVVAIKGKAEAGKRIGLTIGPEKIETYGGKGAVVISADIVASNGEHLSTLTYAQDKSIEVWEKLCSELQL